MDARSINLWRDFLIRDASKYGRNQMIWRAPECTSPSTLRRIGNRDRDRESRTDPVAAAQGRPLAARTLGPNRRARNGAPIFLASSASSTALASAGRDAAVQISDLDAPAYPPAAAGTGAGSPDTRGTAARRSLRAARRGARGSRPAAHARAGPGACGGRSADCC
jgi:hypothetical protein